MGKLSQICVGAITLVAVGLGAIFSDDSSSNSTVHDGGGVSSEVVVDAPSYDVSPKSYNDPILDSHHPSAVGNNQIVRHIAFMLSYNEIHEQADWVMYRLSADMVKGSADRETEFNDDPDVVSGSATTQDYTGSGFDRGHLCASADIRNNSKARCETYYMSNISPQLHDFNAGIWNDLEQQVRSWARKKGELYVVTGPVLSDMLEKIEKHKKRKGQSRNHYHGVSVPVKFYKVLYSPQDGGHMIGFLFDNEGYPDGERISNHTIAVDYIERLTGIDFFPGVPNEAALEVNQQSLKWWNNK